MVTPAEPAQAAPIAHRTEARVHPLMLNRQPPFSPCENVRNVRNEALSTLPSEVFEKVAPQLERVPLRVRLSLQEPNLPIAHAYFIEEGLASLFSRDEDHTCIEVRSLGTNTLSGMPLVLGAVRSPHRCIVQAPGEALRIRADDLQDLMLKAPALQQHLLGYVHAAMVESAQLVLCASRHTLLQRLARWLLTVSDRMGGSDEVPLTHRAIGRALGVRRASVTSAIGNLEKTGVLGQVRGRILIRDPVELANASCQCHRTIGAEYQRRRMNEAVLRSPLIRETRLCERH